MLQHVADPSFVEAPPDSQSDCDALAQPVGAKGMDGGKVTQRLYRAAGTLLLLAATAAALLHKSGGPGPAAPTPQLVEPIFASGANLSLLKDYVPINAQAMGECTGSVMAAGLWIANLGLIIRSAIANCPVGKLYEEIQEDNIPWFPNGTLKPRDDRRLAEIEDPETRAAFLRMAIAKKRVLEDLKPSHNETLNKNWNTFLKQQHADLKAICTRDVLEFISTSAIVAEYFEVAEVVCGSDEHFKQDCRIAVTGIVNKVHRTARFGTQMEIRCPKRSRSYNPASVAFVPDASYDCEGRMEGVAWEEATIGSKIEKAIAYCGPEDKEVGPINMGGCVTMVVSAAAFLGASAIALDTAGELDCINMTQYDMVLAEKAARGDEEAYEELVDSQAGRGLYCARDIISSVRTMGLASMKASLAAQWCGGHKTVCGQDIAKAATAFAAAVESFVIDVHQCKLKPFHNDGSDIKKRNIECTAYAASAMKEMSVAAAMSFDASNSCRHTNSAAGVCASSVSKALAAFGYMMERTALAGKNCPFPGVQDGSKSYACGQNLEQAGEATLIATTAIGSATINCGLGMRPSPTRHFGLNRRFWVPR